MEISFKGHRALVTGAGKGIGRATVKVLWSLGAEVVALSRTAEDLESLAQEIRVNSVNPTLVMTKMGLEQFGDPEKANVFVSRIPLGHIAGTMEISFKGHRALVTGAGKGIGRETVKALWASGAEVVALNRTSEDLESLVQECPGVQTVCVDLADWPATEAAMSSVGTVDLLVNNAGIEDKQSFLEITQDSFDRIIAVNTRAIIPVSQIVARQIIERGVSGSIVNVSSQLSQSPIKNFGAYSTSKAAVDMLTKVMALELGPQKIRVNSVNPTLVMTRMGQHIFNELEEVAELIKHIPLGHIAEIKDVTNAILFLLSDKSAMITGSCLNVEGGFLI